MCFRCLLELWPYEHLERHTGTSILEGGEVGVALLSVVEVSHVLHRVNPCPLEARDNLDILQKGSPGWGLAAGLRLNKGRYEYIRYIRMCRQGMRKWNISRSKEIWGLFVERD